MKPPALVEALNGLKEDFLKRHRKDAHPATQVWQSIIDKAPALAQDIGYGDAIPRVRWPRRFRDHPDLSRLELSHSHRALYAAYYDGERDLHKVVIEWIGSHKQYDELFRYASRGIEAIASGLTTDNKSLDPTRLRARQRAGQFDRYLVGLGLDPYENVGPKVLYSGGAHCSLWKL